jgi:hypothetical protein
LCARSLSRGSYQTLAKQWSARIDEASTTYVARELYCGRVVTETLRASNAIQGIVTFISAGLGLVADYARIPAYSLTASPGSPDSIAARLTEPFDAAKWWQALGRARPREGGLVKLLRSYRVDIVLVALPGSYLTLIQADLAALPRSKRSRLRIIGPRRGSELPEELSAQWLPYDGRLDNPGTSFNGTASDFPQRALRHFVTHILPHARRMDAAGHSMMVNAALGDGLVYARPRGRSASDEEVLSQISKLWLRFGGRRNLILRELRRTLRIACEQSRFKRLADAYAETRCGAD